MKHVAAITLLALGLTGCISFGAKPPASLISLSSTSQLASGDARTTAGSDALAIAVPLVPQAIAGNRVAVSTRGVEIAYVKDAAWAEPPARLFQRLLAETVTAKTGKVVLDPRQFAMANGAVLTGQLKNFGISVETSGDTAGEALVVFDAAYSKDRGKKVLTKRFEARSSVATIDSRSVGPALNRAANDVADQVSGWLGSN